MQYFNIKMFAFLAFLFIGTLPAMAQPTEDLTQYVNPLIGTKEMGHVFPGACVPFGMVQLSPDTDTIPYAVNGKYTGTVYRYCAGYQYNDKTIVGFSHTHLSGTGHSDLSDFLKKVRSCNKKQNAKKYKNNIFCNQVLRSGRAHV